MGKSKGSSFEREVAKLLSLWVSSGTRDDIFWRTNASGARATQRAKSGKETANQYGDLTYTDPLGEPLIKKYNFELKTGYSTTGVRWDVLDILDSKQKTPMLYEFWNQTIKDSELSGRIPILIFRRTNRQILMCIPIQLYNCIMTFSCSPIDKITLNDELIIIKFNDFLEATKNYLDILYNFKFRE